MLPSWIPARRTLGGFFVLRSLGKGGVGSVFVAKRIEERNDPNAESFALKVPEFDAQVARHMSEARLLADVSERSERAPQSPVAPEPRSFRHLRSGSAPQADLGDGAGRRSSPSRCSSPVVSSRPSARLALIDGVLAGLEAMHSVGVAHLDLKPTNVVMRKGKEPVLVDFGLAGRHLRLGCGSGPYGAPEVWGLHHR